MGYQVFVVISTGQQVANLPPILAMAKRNDKVLWLESEFARDRKWADGAIELLKKKGLHQFTSLIDGDMDEPGVVGDSLLSALDDSTILGNACDRLCIVLNGGKKLTPVGLIFAAQELALPEQSELLFLYGDNQPVQMKVHPSNIMQEQEIFSYDPSRMLTAEEMFQVNGLSMTFSRRWVWGMSPEDDRYGVDDHFTRRVHDCYNRGFDNLEGSAENTTDWPAYQQWVDRSQQAWKQAIGKNLDRLEMPHSADALDALAISLSSVVRNFSPKIRQRQLTDEEKKDLLKDGWIDASNSMKLGYRFENAVWRRTVSFLSKNPRYQSIVKECLLGVTVKRGSMQESELDVVLTLTNGILIHLECKTWAFEKKEADARIQVLQKASSRLATMYAVAPLFPSMDDADWFQGMYQRYERMKTNIGSANVIAFSMPTPPDEFTVRVKKYTEKRKSPPSFEVALGSILERYL